MHNNNWPQLKFNEWIKTCDTLHMWTQIVGKTKVKLCPFLNEYWHAGLDINARGLTTGPMPYNKGMFQVSFDFIDHELNIETSIGETKTLKLKSTTVADFFHEYFKALEALKINVSINPIPSETSSAISFETDREHSTYDEDQVERWWKIQILCTKAFQKYRSGFLGKSSPILFYWGSFDLATTRYSGRGAPLPEGPLFYKLAEDQENFNCGFWTGNSGPNGLTFGEPAFYAYAYPAPEKLSGEKIKPEKAYYDHEFNEFILRYEDVRNAADPEKAILDFLNSTYDAASTLGGWDRSFLENPEVLGSFSQTM